MTSQIQFEGAGAYDGADDWKAEDKEFIALCKLSELLDQQLNEVRLNKISTLFPDSGPFRRDLYPKHCQFMAAGAAFRQRAFIAANRVGKTLCGAVEMAYHLTGRYPKWWTGRRFVNAVDAWAVGVSNQETKEVMQAALLGEIEAGELGTGTIPHKYIKKITKKPGVAGAVETVLVEHVSGKLSKLTFKAYEQRRASFQGVKKQVIWLDEEPIDDPDIYSECLTRTADQYNPGIIYCTFTPLANYSKIVESFLPNIVPPENGVDPANPYKFVLNVGWDDCPHLTEEDKAELRDGYGAHELNARTKGEVVLGHGAIYPFPDEDISVAPFPIPDYWPRAYGLDVGWKKTAAVWVAQNPDTEQYFIYSEHYESHSLAPVHASAIKARGDWIYGVIDTGSKQVSATDGKCLYDQYIIEGLLLQDCKKAKEASILKLTHMFLSGQIKVFSTCTNWFQEKRKYRRNVDGKIVDGDDHLMDATNYLILDCPYILRENPELNEQLQRSSEDERRDSYTGY